MTFRKRKKTKKHCIDCGAVLKKGYWRRCDSCWKNKVNDIGDSNDYYQLKIKIDEDNI
jgi:hypothetical protein